MAEARKKLSDIRATVTAEGEKAAAAAPGDALAKEQARNKRMEELFAQYASPGVDLPSEEGRAGI